MCSSMEFEISEQDDSVLVEVSGNVDFECSIIECYRTSVGDYELVSYNGDEFGFDPNGQYLMVFGPGIRFSLSSSVASELDSALRSVFEVEE